MIPVWLAAVIVAAAVTLTYLFCVRPMRRGEGCHMGTACNHKSEPSSTEELLARLRTQVELARQQLESSRSVGDNAGTTVSPPRSTTG